MKVLLLDGSSENEHEYLRSLLEPGVELLVDADSADYEIAIAHRLADELLTRSTKLRAVVVPWAGMPKHFGELLSKPEYTHISLHNSHYNALPVAEYAFTLLLMAAKNIGSLDRALRRGDWTQRYRPASAVLLHGKTVLILGFGAIGRNVAALCKGIGMNVLATRRSIVAETENALAQLHPPSDLHKLLPRADALICCLPLTEETKGLIGADELAMLPERAVVVNVGRGAVFEEEALFSALQDGTVHAAGLDVWYQYPRDEIGRKTTHPSRFPFYELENVVMSPHHSAALADRADMRLRMESLAEIINAAARGEEIPNRMNIARGY